MWSQGTVALIDKATTRQTARSGHVQVDNVCSNESLDLTSISWISLY